MNQILTINPLCRRLAATLFLLASFCINQILASHTQQAKKANPGRVNTEQDTSKLHPLKETYRGKSHCALKSFDEEIQRTKNSCETIYYEVLQKKNLLFSPDYSNFLILSTNLDSDFPVNGKMLLDLIDHLEENALASGNDGTINESANDAKYLLSKINKLFYLVFHRALTRIEAPKEKQASVVKAFHKLYRQTLPAEDSKEPHHPFRPTLSRLAISLLMLDFSNLAYDVKKEQVLFQLEKFRKHLDEINETLGSHGVVESHLDNLIDTLEAYYVFDPLLGKPRDLKKKAIMWLIGITVTIIICYLLHRYREPITRNINNFFGGIAKAFGDQIRETVVQPILDDAEDRSEDLKELVKPALETINEAVEITRIGVDKLTETAKGLPQQLGDEVQTAVAGLPGKLAGGALRSIGSTITSKCSDPVTAARRQQAATLEEKNAREKAAALQEEAKTALKRAVKAQEEAERAHKKIADTPQRRLEKARRKAAALQEDAQKARQKADEAARAAQAAVKPPVEAPQPPAPEPVVQPEPVPLPVAVQPPPADGQTAKKGWVNTLTFGYFGQ